MENISVQIQPYFQWLLRSTLQASIIICLILLIQIIFRNKLGIRWHHALWLILLIRMVLPWTPQSRFSIFNLVSRSDNFYHINSGVMELPNKPTKISNPMSSVTQSSSSDIVTNVNKQPKNIEQTSADLQSSKEFTTINSYRTKDVIPLIWVVGALLLVIYVVMNNIKLWFAISIEHPSTDEKVLQLLEECREKMGIRTITALVESSKVGTPVLLGFIRPRLLIPKDITKHLSHEELRYIFLHELAHVKRNDIALAWLTAILQVLHWFNPLVWLAFHRMRTDRELACDALVLTQTKGDGPKDYGRAIINLMEHLSFPPRLPGLAGILENKSQLKRRIQMITKFKSNSYRWSPLAVILIIAIGCMSLPNARKNTIAGVGNMPGQTSAVSTQGPTFNKLQITNKIPWDVSLSPDGKNIAFVSEDKLWIMPRASQSGADYPGVARLVDTDGMKVDWAGLAWSGDGRWIAFNNLKNEAKGNQGICVIPAEGGKPKEVYENYREMLVLSYRMSLSPNGKMLTFSSVDGNELHIYTIPVDGGKPKQLVEAQAREPVFSPDGKMIAYVEDKDLGRQGGSLWVVPAEGGTPKRVVDAVNASSPVWSPDGRRIAFLDYKGQLMATTQIHIVPVDADDGKAGQEITVDFPGVDEITRLTGWTPDNKIGVVCKGHLEFGLYTMPAHGGVTMLVEHGTYASAPRWSPDGKRILFATNATGNSGGWTGTAIASIPAEGGEPTSILIPSDNKIRKPPYGSGNRVSPDGKTIVFAGTKTSDDETYIRGSRVSHIWTMPLEGGKLVQLTNAGESFLDECPCWSPDGKTIAFVRAKDNPNMTEALKDANIWLVPTAGGEPRQLTSKSDAFVAGSIAWSPDGRLLAYFSADKEWSEESMSLRVIPVDGGQSRTVGKVPAIGFNTEMAWSPDSKRLALNGKMYEKVIKVMSIDDGSTVDIKPDIAEPSSIWHLDWSHDGTRFVFAGCQGSSGDAEFWTIENFLPATSAKDSK